MSTEGGEGIEAKQAIPRTWFLITVLLVGLVGVVVGYQLHQPQTRIVRTPVGNSAPHPKYYSPECQAAWAEFYHRLRNYGSGAYIGVPPYCQ